MRVVRREEHGAEAVRVDHGARARRVGREAVAGPALVLAELAAAAVEARVAPPHVDAEDGAPRGPVEPVLRRPEPAERRAVGPREEGHRLRRPPEEAAVRVRGRGRGGEPLAGEPRGEAFEICGRRFRFEAAVAPAPAPAPAPQRSSGSRPRHAAASPSAAQPTRRIAGVRKRARASTAARNGLSSAESSPPSPIFPSMTARVAVAQPHAPPTSSDAWRPSASASQAQTRAPGRGRSAASSVDRAPPSRAATA